MSTPTTMRYVDIAQPGGPEGLMLREGPAPEPRSGEVLIRVRAAGINRADTYQRRGRYPIAPGVSPILGLEAAGTVAALGPGASRWKEGDAVCALLSGGGYAEYVAVPAAHCLPIPAGWDAVSAASLPETFFTVWFDVYQIGRFAMGESLLVHGGSSGIGVTAIQIAHCLGSKVYVTAGSAEKCEACLGLGADGAVNYREKDFEKEISRLTGGRGVDVILDMVGGEYVGKNLRALAPGGRLVFINFMGGSQVDVDLSPVMRNQLTITGSMLRPQPAERKTKIAAELEERVWPLLAAGRIKPVIDRVYPLAEAAEAHRRMESSQHIGKIVLKLD